MWSWYIQIVIFYALGIFLGQKIGVNSAVVFSAALFLCALIISLVKKKPLFSKAFIISFVALGIISYSYAIDEGNKKLGEFSEKYVHIAGKVVDLPEYSEDNNAYIVKVKRVVYSGKIYDVDDKIRLMSEEVFGFGDSIEAKGHLKAFEKPMNEGSFDVARYYKTKGIYFSLYTYDAKISEFDFKENDLFYFITYIKSKISQRINEYFEGDASAIMHATLIGYKNFFFDESEELLYETDFMRLFYPVFVHLGILVSLCGFLARYIGRKKTDKLLLILLIGYALFNFNIPHAVKTAGVLFVSTLFKEKRGYSNGIESVVLVSGVMLFINPLLIFHRGFLLSVVCNIILIRLSPIVYYRLKIKNKDIKRLITLWLLLWVGMLPLQSYMFSKTTPYSVVTSFFMLPLMSTFCLTAPLQLVFAEAFTLEAFSKIFNLFYILPNAVTYLPFSKIPLARPSELMVIAFYLAMAIVWFSYYRRKRNFVKILKILLCVLLVLECITNLLAIGKLRVDFVNVSQGDGAVISTKYGDTIIIDGGGTNELSDYNYGKEEFLPFLMRNDFYDIDMAVVSHYHNDHTLGIIEALENLKVRSVLMPDCMEDNPNRQRIEELAKINDTEIIYAKEGMEFRFKSGIVLRVISARNKTDFENNTSLCIKVSFGESSLLFMGDASSWIEKKRLSEWGECTVLKVAHHGSENSSCNTFLKETSPEICVISVNEKSGYNLPNKNTLKRLEKSGAKILRTDKNGNIKLYAKKDGSYFVKTFYQD